MQDGGMSKKGKKENSHKINSNSSQPTTLSLLWKQKNLAVPLIFILCVTALVYARALQNGILLWDDGWHVTNNTDIQSLSVQNIVKICTSFYGNMYHPLTTLTFAIEYQLFGLSPAVYHATNILFHLANVVLVFLFVFRLSGRREIAIIAACLFGIHPMHVESVAWITERKDVVYAFFYLSALISYVRFVQKEGKKYYWLTILFFMLSLFSKTTALTLPVVLLLIDFYLHRKIKTGIIVEKLPMVLLSIVFGMIALHSQTDSMNYAQEIGITILDRFFFLLYSVCYYCIHLFVPMNLSALHLMPEKINGFLPREYYLAVLPMIAFIFLGIRKGVLQREYIFGTLFFIATISLSLHIVPVGMAVVAERYTYMPYIGLYFLVGQFYCYFVDRQINIAPSGKRVIVGIALVLMTLLGFLTYQRIGVWKRTDMLFHDATVKANSVKEARYIEALGYELEAADRNKSRKYAEAIEWYTKVIALSPNSVESYTNRGVAKHCLQDYDGAMRDYTKAIELNPSLPRPYPNRAAIYLLWNKQKEACADLWTAYNLGLHNVFEIVKVDCP
jgi:protein O-mannosyl-transferase